MKIAGQASIEGSMKAVAREVKENSSYFTMSAYLVYMRSI